ncbi:major facilitator superfamily domain [Trichoderma cornu-damae]|uniref:Major facilitator superfamily domain n=1 Tax=Trichoderma cornu-damae TaxID=654480 RepID=A0A9P8TZ81_9HYPO|nr:major facilitator superfamily domain [Trichoderma cornu-damae]
MGHSPSPPHAPRIEVISRVAIDAALSSVDRHGQSEKQGRCEEPSIVLPSTINAAYDWTGPDDPDNPRNFPASVRIFSTIAITMLAMIGTVAGSMYAPAQDAVASSLRCSRLVAVLPLSLYNLGLAFGPMVGAPLSETCGRKSVFVLSTPVFALFLLGSGLSRSMASLAACRFFAGVFASPLINNAPAALLDFTPPRYRGVSLGGYYAVPSFGAALGPLIGGFVLLAKPWQWTQWISIFITVAFYIPVCFTRETYKKVILKRRATRLGLRDSASQRTSPGRAFRYFFTTLIQRPLHMLFTEPIVTLVSVYNGFLFGLLYTFVVSVPWIYKNYYGWSAESEPLSYLGLLCGTALAAAPLILIDLQCYQKRLAVWRLSRDDDEPLPSENRLMSALVGSVLLPICLFIVGWAVHFQVHWIVPIIFQGLVMLSSLLVYAGANLFMLDAYGPLYGASASGSMMFSRYLLSAAFPLFALQMYERLGAGWATSVLGFVTMVMAPIPWFFRAYGEKLRARSNYEMSI